MGRMVGRVVGLAGLMGVGVILVGQGAGPAGKTVSVAATAPAGAGKEDGEAALLVKVPVHFKNAALDKVLGELGKSAGVSVFVDEKSIKEAGVEGSPVTLDLEQAVPLRKALELVETAAGEKLEYFIEDGVLEITTGDGLNKTVWERTYDVRGLLAEAEGRVGENEDDVVKELVDTIKTVATPEAWRDAGGTLGSLREMGGKLLVTGNPKTQREVKAVLEAMESGVRRLVPAHEGAARAWEEFEPGAGQVAADGVMGVGVDLLGRLHAGNLLYSPLSLSGAMAMVDVGARGKTREEIEGAMHFAAGGEGSKDVGALLARMIPPEASTEPAATRDASSEAGYRALLEITNRMYVSPKVELRAEFVELARKQLNARAAELDFSDAKAAVEVINADIAKATGGLIRDAVGLGDIDPGLQGVVLVNTLYFKGAWAKAFAKEDTRPATFFVPGQKSRTVAMMELANEEMGYCDQGAFQAVCVPYKDPAFGLLVILPTDLDGLKGVEKQMTVGQMGRLLGRMRARAVHLNMPRFTLRDRHDLIPALEAMGVKAAFGLGADLSGMSSQKMDINFVLQQCVLRVDEEGTEAAAATEVGGSLFGAVAPPPVPVTFRVDHPCLMVLLHLPTQTPLMVARLAEPEEMGTK